MLDFEKLYAKAKERALREAELLFSEKEHQQQWVTDHTHAYYRELVDDHHPV